MKLPNKVRIGGVEYPVVYKPYLNDGSNLAYGHIDYEKSLISLSETIELGDEKKCIVLWHEILHGIRNHAGLEIENEEEVIDMFSKGIYQVLQDNANRFFDIECDSNAP